MDALAAEAFLNAEHRVCGLRMLPLSLGHAFTLEAIDSPFYAGQQGTVTDLRVAAWICSRPALALLNMNTLGCRLWKKKAIDFTAECARWRTYVADYCAGPQMWSRQTKPGEARAEPSKIPNTINTVVRLMRLGMSERQAWATPIGMAAWYEASAYENESGNRLDIVTEADRISIARAKNRQAEKEAANV